jgi:hypothetical protein
MEGLMWQGMPMGLNVCILTTLSALSVLLTILTTFTGTLFVNYLISWAFLSQFLRPSPLESVAMPVFLYRLEEKFNEYFIL